MTKKILAACFVTGMMFACGGTEDPDPQPMEKTAAELGQEVYSNKCSACHGVSTAGVTGQGPALPGSLTDMQISDIITNGQGTTMPAGLIAGTDIDNVLAYLRSL